MILRLYTPGDRGACLRIFRANIPRYFLTEEEPAFLAYLADPGPHYAVVEAVDAAAAGATGSERRGSADVRRIVGCGGPAMNADGTWSVCWMMVEPALQGTGLGSRMVAHCQEVVRRESPGGILRLDTSQHTEGFYHRMGFATVSRTEDGYGPGMHRIEMRQVVTPPDGG
jgi:GNAT superfamily N-acetyltransferase